MAKDRDYSLLFTCSLVLHPANEPRGALHTLQRSEESSVAVGQPTMTALLVTRMPKLSPTLL